MIGGPTARRRAAAVRVGLALNAASQHAEARGRRTLRVYRASHASERRVAGLPSDRIRCRAGRRGPFASTEASPLPVGGSAAVGADDSRGAAVHIDGAATAASCTTLLLLPVPPLLPFPLPLPASGPPPAVHWYSHRRRAEVRRRPIQSHGHRGRRRPRGTSRSHTTIWRGTSSSPPPYIKRAHPWRSSDVWRGPHKVCVKRGVHSTGTINWSLQRPRPGSRCGPDGRAAPRCSARSRDRPRHALIDPAWPLREVVDPEVDGQGRPV